jgi:predicted NBD/HSP70 family sugar kinase
MTAFRRTDLKLGARDGPATAASLRQMNRSSVVNFIRREKVVSPSAIALALGLSMPTVTRVIDGLMTEDIVEHDGYSASTGGRPAARIRFKGNAHSVIGLDLGGGEFFGAVCDLDGAISFEASVAVVPGDGAANLKKLIALLSQLLESRPSPRQDVRSIAIGVPSIVPAPGNMVPDARQLGWRDLPLRDILEKEFGRPVYLENDVNLSAVGEWGFGAGMGAGSIVSLVIEASGTGAGIILGGRLYRGSSHTAGEIGWMLHDPILVGGAFAQLGERERLAGGIGFSRETFRHLARIAKKVRGVEDPSAVLKPADRDFLNEIVRYVSVAVAAVSMPIDPERIVLCGEILVGAPLIIDLVTGLLTKRLPHVPEIVPSTLGHRAAAMGAVLMALDTSILNIEVAHAS